MVDEVSRNYFERIMNLARWTFDGYKKNKIDKFIIEGFTTGDPDDLKRIVFVTMKKNWFQKRYFVLDGVKLSNEEIIKEIEKAVA